MSREPALTQLRLADLSEQDLQWLIVATRGDKFGYTARYFVSQPEGTFQFWRVLPPAKGLVVTRIAQHPDCKVLDVFAIGGKGVYPTQIEFVIADLQEQAKIWDCKYVYALNLHRGLDRKLGKLADRLGTAYILESSDERR